MEHRDPPFRATAQPAESVEERKPLGSRRFSRFVPPPHERRLALPRVALAALAVSGILVMVALLGRYAVTSLPSYLHRQPVYLFRFRDIELVPPPPVWYRGGSEAFLARVSAAAHQPEQQSVLDLDLERLAGVFRLDPWVAKVSRIERAYPRRVAVHLVYRQPVAFVSLGRSGVVLLDGEGVVLSEKDFDRRALGALVQLNDVKIPPASARPGEKWKRASTTGIDLEVDELVVHEAALAGYLKSVENELDRGDGRRLNFTIRVRKGLWVQYGHRYFFWGEAPGYESADPIKAAAKWEMLRDWLLESPPPDGPISTDLEFYKITPTGIEFIPSPRSGG